MFYFYAYFTIYIFQFSFRLSLSDSGQWEWNKIAYLIIQLFFTFMFKVTLGKKLDDLLLKDINVYPVFPEYTRKLA